MGESGQGTKESEMMRSRRQIYRLSCGDEGQDCLTWQSGEDRVLDTIVAKAKPVPESYDIPVLTRLFVEPDIGPPSDFARHIRVGVIVANLRATELLVPFLQENDQIIRLNSDCGDYNMIHITTVLDCLDVDHCEGVWLEPRRRAAALFDCRFKASALSGPQIFHVPEQLAYVFVTDAVADALLSSHLGGYQLYGPYDVDRP